ncbi:MAG: TonB-dependent receptor [Candidatus Acidiferrales bacterium]
MNGRVLKTILLSVIVVAFAAGTAKSQTTNGTLVGSVVDQQGAVIPGAQISVVNQATGEVRSAVTAANGVFRVDELPVGVYRLTAVANGLSNGVINRIEIAVDQTQSVRLVLGVAGQQQSVTVTGSVSLVNTQTSQLGQVVGETQVTTLPLNGRNFAQLALLNPGVAAFGGGGGQQGGEGGTSGFSSNGQRSSSNNFMVDGIDNNDYLGGSVAQLPSIDSIQEFDVQTNTFSAEYGRNSGSVVNLVTKSGTNQFHGSAYEFFRNDILDGQNFFADPDLGKPELRLNQFGFTAGGPIIKDKTFFFGNYEGFRQVAGITVLTNVPTVAERQGIFTDSQGNPVQVTVNPVSAKLFNLFPLPNTSQPSGNFVSSPALTNSTNQYMMKVDQRLGGSDSLSFRYSYTGADIYTPLSGGQQSTSFPGYGSFSNGSDHLASISYVKILSPNSLNEFRFGFTRVTDLGYNQETAQAADYGFNTGWPTNSPLNLGNIPYISFGGGLVSGGGSLANLGGSDNNPGGDWQNVLQFIDNFTHSTARHDIKFGANISNYRINRFYDLDDSGEIIFSGGENPQGLSSPLADFAEGLPSSSLHFVGDSARSFRLTNYSLFAEDSFKASSQLTLNYGIRYELSTVLHDATNRLSTWVPSDYQHYLSPTADQTDLSVLEQSGIVTQGQTGLYDGNHRNFAPRVGIAWSTKGQRPIVIRSSYGIFYDFILGEIPTNALLNPPYLPDYYDSAPAISWPQAFAPAGFPVLTTTAQQFATPYAQDWNLDVQKELPGNMLFETSYVGTKGTHLPRFVQIDQAYNDLQQIDSLTPDLYTRLTLMGIPSSAAQYLAANPELSPSIARVPYFGFAQIFQAQNVVNSEYNSLQVKLNKRVTHGLQFLLSYTYSHSIDGASDFYGSGGNGGNIFPQNDYDLAAERGSSDFDIRHRLVWSYIYEAPSLKRYAHLLPTALSDGWELSGILTLQTGQPFTVLTGGDNSGTGLGTDRPNVTCNPNIAPRTVQQWFNTSCFQPNAVFAFGDEGRNTLVGPGFDNFDFAVLKNTKITERVNLQFRTEFFNILNHPNFAIPSSTMNAPNFGALFETADVAQNNVGLGSGGPRLIQFGLKLNF